MNAHRFTPAVLLPPLLLLSILGGCAMESWVKPYEREHLSDPIMNPPRDPISDKHRQHVFDTREAARGATTSEGGGCGCN
ncbi:MAG TPA: DUF4266 domain-containing protein [Candidatus Methylomirabilis sp.]|nr:DUF4266 domain-containing protein [Candidatus Methylomirabilis sp.]